MASASSASGGVFGFAAAAALPPPSSARPGAGGALVSLLSSGQCVLIFLKYKLKHPTRCSYGEEFEVVRSSGECSCQCRKHIIYNIFVRFHMSRPCRSPSPPVPPPPSPPSASSCLAASAEVWNSVVRVFGCRSLQPALHSRSHLFSPRPGVSRRSRVRGLTAVPPSGLRWSARARALRLHDPVPLWPPLVCQGLGAAGVGLLLR